MDASPDRLVARAKECFDAGDAYGAIHLLTEVIGTGKAFADARNLLGLAYSMVGKKEEALAEFDYALQLNPRYVDALLNRALVLNDLGRYDEAVDVFTAAQQLGRADHTGFSAPVASKLANLHAELAEAYLEAGGMAQAIAQYEAAARLRPEFLDLRYRLARLYVDDGQFARAQQELKAVLERRPGNVQARALLGMACYLMKDLAGARAAWEACAEASPDDPRVRAYVSLLSRVGS